MLLGGMLVACNNKQITNNNMEQKLELTQEWDKVFPLSEKVNHVAQPRPTSIPRTSWLLLISCRNRTMWMPNGLASSASAVGVA